MTENKEDVDDKSTDQNAITESDMNLDRSIQEIFHLLNNYEGLVIEIQKEAKNCRLEKEKLRNNLAALIDENKRLKSEPDEDELAKFRANYIDVADRIFNNLRSQMEMCHKEKEMYENLWKRTSSVLEQEIPRNSIAKLKTEYSMEVRQLQKDLITTQTECKREKEINAALRKNIKEMLEKLKSIQMENKGLHDDNNLLREQMQILETSKEETEKLLDESNELNKEQMKKSTESFQKMQEAIRLTECAILETDHQTQQKKQIEDEYNHLTESINSVLEQASERVEKDLEDIQKRHCDEVAEYKAEIERLKHIAELEKERTTSAMHHASAVQEKLQSTDKTNSLVGKDLQDARRQLDEARTEIVKISETVVAEKEKRQELQYEVEKLRSVIEHNRHVNLKWKDIMLDIAKQVQEKIKNLMIENHELKVSRRIL